MFQSIWCGNHQIPYSAKDPDSYFQVPLQETQCRAVLQSKTYYYDDRLFDVDYDTVRTHQYASKGKFNSEGGSCEASKQPYIRDGVVYKKHYEKVNLRVSMFISSLSCHALIAVVNVQASFFNQFYNIIIICFSFSLVDSVC